MEEKTHEFNDFIKREIVSALPSDKSEARAFLSAYSKIKGSIEIKKGRINLAVEIDSYSDAVGILAMFKTVYNAEFEIEMSSSSSKKGGSVRLLVPKGYVSVVLADLGLATEKNGDYCSLTQGVPSEFAKNESLAVQYLRACFLAKGSAYVPTHHKIDENDEVKMYGYHFEIACADEFYASEIRSLMSRFSIDAKMSERGQSHLVYLKDKDLILQIVSKLGLVESASKLNSIIIERAQANMVNREAICSAANLDKTFEAASKHLLAIGIIEETVGLDSLSVELRETAKARMDYQQESLSELAEILNLSKSCLNHRLRKIVEIANSVDD